MEKNKYRLKLWSATVFHGMPFILWGRVYGNPKFPDGLVIHTSQVVGVKDCGDHKEVETMNSIYCIYPEEILDKFAAAYPDFYENLDEEDYVTFTNNEDDEWQE